MNLLIKLTVLFALCTILGFDGDVTRRVFPVAPGRDSLELRAIWNAIDMEIRTWDYNKSLGPYFSRYKFELCSYDQGWAYVAVIPRRFPDRVLPDGVGVLLRKKRDKWSVIRMGTDEFSGEGARFRIPRPIWERWKRKSDMLGSYE